MKQRRSPRVTFRASAEATIRDLIFTGYIENFSMEGILKIIHDGEELDPSPGLKCGVSFESPFGETLNLDCVVRWLRNTPNLSHGRTRYDFGLEIKDPPLKYKEFVETLYNLYDVDD